MTEIPREAQSCSFCRRTAIWHFGTERWLVAVGYVMGRFTVAGETLHTCGSCGLRLRRWADKQSDQASWAELHHV